MKVPAASRVAEPARPAGLPRLSGQALAALQDELAGRALEVVGAHPLLAPLGHAPEPAVLSDGPEVRDLASERAGNRLEQVRRGLVEAVGAGDRARHPVLRGEARGVALELAAQAGDEHGHARHR